MFADSCVLVYAGVCRKRLLCLFCLCIPVCTHTGHEEHMWDMRCMHMHKQRVQEA